LAWAKPDGGRSGVAPRRKGWRAFPFRGLKPHGYRHQVAPRQISNGRRRRGCGEGGGVCGGDGVSREGAGNGARGPSSAEALAGRGRAPQAEPAANGGTAAFQAARLGEPDSQAVGLG